MSIDHNKIINRKLFKAIILFIRLEKLILAFDTLGISRTIIYKLCASSLTADVHRKQLLSFHRRRRRRCRHRLSWRSDRSICDQDSLRDGWFCVSYENASSRGLDLRFRFWTPKKIINSWVYRFSFLYRFPIYYLTFVQYCRPQSLVVISFKEIEVSLVTQF